MTHAPSHTAPRWREMAEAPKDQELLVKGGRYQVAAETYPEWYETKGVALVQWREYDNGWRGEMCDGDYLWYRPTHFITVADLLAPCTEHPQPVTSKLLEAAKEALEALKAVRKAYRPLNGKRGAWVYQMATATDRLNAAIKSTEPL